jgi:hypothetical protein
MSRYNAHTLYELLPAVYRQRDGERGHLLRDLIEVLGEQAQILEEEIERLYRNWFIETCHDWVVPYIGDLIGVRPTSSELLGTRAEIANTLGYRRRKGTLAVVDQLARDVTGWPARAVEYFTLLSTNQSLNHLRLGNHGSPDLRNSAALANLGGPFESTAHLLEVRRIERGAGRYNIPNIGVHVWRLSAYELNRAIAHEVEGGTGLHYTFSPLGNDMQLFRRRQNIERPFDIAAERNVPDLIPRRALHEQLSDFYGDQSSIAVWQDGEFIESEQVAVCDLTAWAHPVPTGMTIAIDPELGRIAFASQPESEVRVRYHYGFSADIGGGPYDRREAADRSEVRLLHVVSDPSEVTDEDVEGFETINDALVHWNSLSAEERQQRPTVIEIDDNSTYSEALSDIDLPQGASLTIRAANRKRPTLLLRSELNVVGGADSTLELNGLLVANQGARVTGALGALRIKHCTFVPGWGFTESGEPLAAGATSLTIEATTPEVEISNSIIGPMHTAVDAQVRICDAIVDANDASNPAFQGVQEDEAGGLLEILRATVIGAVHATEIRSASDTLFLGRVETVRRQQGCLRFCHVPLGSIVPRRFHCQPAAPVGASPEELESLARAVAPQFTSLRYGDTGYCQLAPDSLVEIRRGAEDESEMGAFSSLKQPQREESLRVRLDEYLRLGMEAGILYVT